MAPLAWCGCRRTSSPDTQPIQLIDTSQPKQRFALSSHSTTPTENIQNVVPMHDTSTSTAEEFGHRKSSATSGHDLLPVHQSGASMHHQPSRRTLQGVASQVRKRISRESGVSKRSSIQTLRTSTSIEDTDRRAELRRALHRRVKNSLLEDSTADEEHYDEDAVPIETPKGTWGRHEGSIKVSPRYLSNILRRSESPSRSEDYQRKHYEAYSTSNSAAITLSRMLTQRAGQLSGTSEITDERPSAETPKRSSSTRQYTFDDENTPKPVPPTRSPSLLGRSSTVIKAIPTDPQIDLGLRNPSFLHTESALEYPLSRESSINSLVADNKEQIHYSKRALPATLVTSRKAHLAHPTSSGIYDTRIRPAGEDWLHGASGLLGHSRHATHISSDQSSNSRDEHGQLYDPDNEELGFGGIDGRNDSPPVSIYHTARTRNHSEGDQTTGSGHIYNMHVPSRLASKSLLPSVSFPQIREHKRQRSFASGGSDDFSVKSQRQTSKSETTNPSVQASSSGLSSPGGPMAWNNLHWRASSSIYSSQPESLMSSQRSSMLRITSLQDRLQQIKANTPNEEIISVPASRGKSIDLEMLEQRMSDISYHSSNESLTRRELAAAETRFAPLPRANTLPKNSRFREELEQISAELALTNPARRRFSNLDGSGEWNRASHAIADKDAKSIWERALREHSQEDANLRHTRLGSEAIGPMGESDRKSVSRRKSSSRPPLEHGQTFLSVDNWQGNELQTRLASYKLPVPSQSPIDYQSIDNPTADKVQRSTPARSTSSWTRYPSHTREERSSSPAGEQDQVYTRDFANMTPSPTPGRSSANQGSDVVKSKDPSNFGARMVASIKHVYHTQNRELERRLNNEARGYRSSISEGGVTEYPELEMLGTISPPLPSPDSDAPIEMKEIIPKPEGVIKKRKSTSKSPMEDPSLDDEARTWSKLYADCVMIPKSPETSPPPIKIAQLHPEDIGPRDKRRRSRAASTELRASTLDFKRSLDLNEEKARERALSMALGKDL